MAFRTVPSDERSATTGSGSEEEAQEHATHNCWGRCCNAVGSFWRKWGKDLLVFVPALALIVSSGTLWVQQSRLQESIMKDNKLDPCTTLLAERSEHMMRPYEFELPMHYVKRTVLENKLAAMVEYGRKPGSERRLIVVLGRRQIGKTRLILGYFRGQKNMYYHGAAKAGQLGEDTNQACGKEHLNIGHVKKIVYEAYRENPSNLTVIFDVPHDAQKADVQQVYEDMKGIVYDDPKRHPVLGVLILSNHYMVDAFPKDKNRYGELWVGNLERSEAEEYLHKVHGDKETLNTMGGGLSELTWADSPREWKWSVEQAVETARYNKNARTLMKMIADSGADGVNGTRLMNTEDDHKLPLNDLFEWVRQFSNVFYFDRQHGAFFFVSPYHQWAFGHPDHRTEL